MPINFIILVSSLLGTPFSQVLTGPTDTFPVLRREDADGDDYDYDGLLHSFELLFPVTEPRNS